MVLSFYYHQPVLLPEILAELNIKYGNKYIDATLGGGGYTDEILRRGGTVLGIDADQDAIDYVRKKFEIRNSKFEINKNVFLEQENFAKLKFIAEKWGFNRISGIVFDLGMSTYQLKKSGRGFSFERDEPLDMRMDKNLEKSAADIINTYSEGDLYEIFTKFAEELHSRAVATAIFRTRTLEGPITRTTQLVEVVDKVIRNLYREASQKEFGKVRIKIQVRIFQALRIVVNNEIENLKLGLSQAIELLEKDGKLIVISYQSLEDRVVKLVFRESYNKGLLKIKTKKPLEPGLEEISLNPRARSAKLRIAQKL